MNILKFLFKGLYKKDIESLKMQLQFTKNDLNKSEDVICQLKETEISLRHDIKSQRNILNELKAEIERLKKSEYILKENITICHKQIEQNNQENKRLRISNDDLKQDKSNLLKTIGSLRCEREKLEESIKDNNNKIIFLSAKVEEFRIKNDVLCEKNEMLDYKNTEYELTINDNNETIKKLNEELEFFVEEKNRELLLKYKEAEGLKYALFATQNEMQAMEEYLLKNKKEIEVLKSKLQDSIQQKAFIEDLRDELADSKKSISFLESELEKSVSIDEIEDRDNQIHFLTKKIEEYRGIVDELKKYIQELEEQIKEKSDEVDILEEDVSYTLGHEQENSDSEDLPTNNPNRRNEEKRSTSEENRAPSTKGKHISEDDKSSSNERKATNEEGYRNENRSKDYDDAKNSTGSMDNIRYRRLTYPYKRRPKIPMEEIATIDFPVIENENIYARTLRSITNVFNHRSSLLVSANDILLDNSVEEISKLRFDLEEAVRTGIPYLTCPCCGNMVKISSRSNGFGNNRREVQFFTHAVRNLPCDLKRQSPEISLEYGDYYLSDVSYLNQLRSLLSKALSSRFSRSKGVTDVKKCVYVSADELSFMKRRLADVSVKYKNIDLVFEFVTPTTNIAHVRDRDIFYLINKKQVLWIFGLEAAVDYEEMSRSVSKDIIFSNKRNVFVFDLEAQRESAIRGELMLKCNWLDAENNWNFQLEKNGKNGIMVSLDQLEFDPDGCRPYYYDADKDYYQKNPEAERPLKQSREELIEEVRDSWQYEELIQNALNQMERDNIGVQAFSNGEKWGFKHENIVLVEPIFDHVPIFNGDFAKVELDGKYGVVDRFGRYQLFAKYDRVEILPNGFILYTFEEKWRILGVIEYLTTCHPTDKIRIRTISKEKSIFYLAITRLEENELQPEELFFVGNGIILKDIEAEKWRLLQSDREINNENTWDKFEITPHNTIKIVSDGVTRIFNSDGTLLEEFDLTVNNNSTISKDENKVSLNQKKDNNRKKKKKKNPKPSQVKGTLEYVEERVELFKVGVSYDMKIISVVKGKDEKSIEYLIVKSRTGISFRVYCNSIIIERGNRSHFIEDRWIKMKKTGYNHDTKRSKWEISLD